MKPIDAIRLQLKCMEMVEGTELDWWEVVRQTPAKVRCVIALDDYHTNQVELALGIIEGKPVWVDTTYYDNHGNKCIAGKCWNFAKEYWATCTWLPPKPSSAMVELLVEDIEYVSGLLPIMRGEHLIRVARVCRKALEELK